MAHARLNAVINERIEELPFDATRGSIEDGGRMRIHLCRDAAAFASELENDEDVEDEELDFLCEQAGLIVTELPDRTSYVRYFEDEDKLEDHWADLCGQIEEDGDPEDEELDEDDEEE